MKMKATELTESISKVLLAKLVPMVTGSPGIGKSDIVRSIAKKFNLFVIDMRLSQCDPTDMLGFPTHDGKRMGYAPPEHFPLEGDALPQKGDGSKYAGWLLFLDEFSSAPTAVQAAAYKLVLDKQVGKYNLHDKVAIVCAGNKDTDGAIVNRLSTAMQSRMIHLELEPDIKAWLNWAVANKLDHRVISYLEGCPKDLHNFDPNHDDKTFACPRTWAFAAKLIDGQDVTPLHLNILNGTLSAGIAHQFNAYLLYCSDLPTIKEIIARPDDTPVPEDPALLYAVSHMAAAYIDEKSAVRMMRYLKRLPMEFGTVSIQAALKRNEELIKVDPIREWAHEIAAEVFT
jgi:hypothetical protein